MRTLNIIRILEIYDVPQVFVAVDAVGIKYLCLHYEIADDGALKYIAVQISDDKLNDFIKGHLDLQNIYTHPEQDNSLYYVTYDNGLVQACLFNGILEPSMLPEKGYYYDDTLADDADILERSIRANSPIIRLAFETPENRHNLEARCLSAALISFQALVDSSFKKLYKGKETDCSTLKVTTFMAASFDVEFCANENLDLFGQSRLGATFEEINKLFSDDDDLVIETLRKLKGFAATNYQRFLNVLLSYGLAVNYKWVYSTLESDVRKRRIEAPRLKSLYDIINCNSELGTEEQEFIGHFTAASIDNGKWTFVPNVGKELKGDCINSGILSGITLGDTRYKISCTATQSINDTTLKEKTKYFLVKYEVADDKENP